MIDCEVVLYKHKCPTNYLKNNFWDVTKITCCVEKPNTLPTEGLSGPCLHCVHGIRKHYSNMEEGGRKATTVQTRALLRIESPAAVHWSIQHLQHHAD